LFGFTLPWLLSNEFEMTDTQTLLAAYAKDHSEPAFRELVDRYIDLVYSTAFRLVGDEAHLAEDITQSVFIALARTAHKLPHDVMLGGWLHQHTRFTASSMMRRERRRQRREQQAVEMNSVEDRLKDFEQVRPLLDEAIGSLASDEQAAIILRFFEQRDFRSIGQSIGSSEDAARMRVNRALDKLHALLRHRGVTLSTAALGTALTCQTLTAAPGGLAASVAATALAGTSAASSTTFTFLKLLSMTKAKLTVISAIVIAGAAIPIILQQQANARLRSQIETLQQQRAGLEQSRQENERLTKLKTDASELDRLRTEHNELVRLRGQVAALRQQPSATTGSATKASSPKTQIAAESPTIPLIPAADWNDVGTAKPNDAVQTLFWATLNKNTNAFLKTLIWDPATKTKLESLFAAAPEAVREKFGSVDGLIWEVAMGGHDTRMAAFGVVSVNVQGDNATLVEEHQFEDGKIRQNPITLRHQDDGWRVVLDEKRLQKFVMYLESVASRSGK
jgi:RNA polymerase sigma factor (sigma-70 family)